MSKGATTWSYTYNADGLRTSRTDGTTTYNYVYNGGLLREMTADNLTFLFAYDANGTPLTVTINGVPYYYVTNIQGDVTAITNQSGVPMVTYTYDAWGNILTCSGSMAFTLGQYNPLTYRGYVFDNETGLYYVSSRYYDPEIGRFINADIVDLLGANGDFASFNLFTYCGNNPVIRIDVTGYFWKEIWDWMVDIYEQNMAIQQQQQQLDTQIRLQQNNILKDTTEAIWDIYMQGIEQQHQAQLQNSMALIEGIKYFTSDFDNALGLATATASMYTVSHGIATIVLTANPAGATAGVVLLALGSLYLYIKDLVDNS